LSKGGEGERQQQKSKNGHLFHAIGIKGLKILLNELRGSAIFGLIKAKKIIALSKKEMNKWPIGW